MNVNNLTIAYVICGASQRGKSTIIKELIDYMLKNGATVIYPSNYTIPNQGDTRCILEYNDSGNIKKKYAFMSAGDNIRCLDNQWNDLDINYLGVVDVVIGSCRTKSSTPSWWNAKSNALGFNRIWFDSNDKFPKIHCHYATSSKVSIMKNILSI
ncbi:MAG: hypothetical protein ACRCWI_06165 [Brevinema sp.]